MNVLFPNTWNVRIVTLVPVQLIDNSRIESTDGVWALIFNVLPIGRSSLGKYCWRIIRSRSSNSLLPTWNIEDFHISFARTNNKKCSIGIHRCYFAFVRRKRQRLSGCSLWKTEKIRDFQFDFVVLEMSWHWHDHFLERIVTDHA